MGWGLRGGGHGEKVAPHNLPSACLWDGLLWLGWIGFNAGSARSAGYLAANAALATHLSGVGGMIGWLVIEKRLTKKATTLGAASGAVAGLVAITPAAGFISPLPSLLLGAIAGAVSLFAIRLKLRFRYDDPPDVVACHYVRGVIATLFGRLVDPVAVQPPRTTQGIWRDRARTQAERAPSGVAAVRGPQP